MHSWKTYVHHWIIVLYFVVTNFYIIINNGSCSLFPCSMYYDCILVDISGRRWWAVRPLGPKVETSSQAQGRLASASSYMLGWRMMALRRPWGLLLCHVGCADHDCVALARYLATWVTLGHGMAALVALVI